MDYERKAETEDLVWSSRFSFPASLYLGIQDRELSELPKRLLARL